jgi:hypothetical protein
MGDRSPKAVHKHASQKLAKVDRLKDQKHQAVSAKQVINKRP